jgi:hypothetical protein
MKANWRRLDSGDRRMTTDSTHRATWLPSYGLNLWRYLATDLPSQLPTPHDPIPTTTSTLSPAPIVITGTPCRVVNIIELSGRMILARA